MASLTYSRFNSFWRLILPFYQENAKLRAADVTNIKYETKIPTLLFESFESKEFHVTFVESQQVFVLTVAYYDRILQ